MRKNMIDMWFWFLRDGFEAGIRIGRRQLRKVVGDVYKSVECVHLSVVCVMLNWRSVTAKELWMAISVFWLYNRVSRKSLLFFSYEYWIFVDYWSPCKINCFYFGTHQVQMNLFHYFSFSSILIVEEDYTRVVIASESLVNFYIIHGYMTDVVYICFVFNF